MGEHQGPGGFVGTLGRIDDGDFVAELSAKTQECVKAAYERAASTNGTGKSELTIKLAIKVDAKGVCEIVPDLKTKLPAVPRGKSVFWADEDGALATKNPRQPDLPFREVQGGAAKDVGADKAAKVRLA